MGVAIGIAVGIFAILGLLALIGFLHFKGVIKLPGSPEIDEATGVKRSSEGATPEDVRGS